MEFFDKLGKKASEAYKATADKTGKLAKETKLKLKINELKTQVNEIYEEIGKRVYENHIRENDENAEQEIEEKCVKIDVLSDEIDSLLKESLELKDKKQCQKCYAEIEKEAKFCKHCGAKQEELKQEPEILEVEVVETVEVSEQQEDTAKSNEESKDEKDINNNLEETVAVESNVEVTSENTEQENDNLEKTVEIESNIE